MSGRDGPVFLTGATGFIGGRLAAALSARGCRLRCLVRRPERASALVALGAELIRGDVTDHGALQQGMAGATAAWHLAGAYDIGVVDRAAMRRTNVEGTRAFLDAGRATHVPRILYVSTTAVLAPAGPGAEMGDPDRPLQPPYATFYQETKAAAHELALRAQASGLPVTIVSPANVYGPGDAGPNARYIRAVLAHHIPGLSTRPAWYSWVHVDDVVQGMVAATERGRSGAHYVLSGEPCDVNTFTRRVAQLASTWGPPLRIPPAGVQLTGSLFDAVGRATGLRLPISRELADMAATGRRWVHPYTRAAEELGYAPRSLGEGLPETVSELRGRR